MWPEIGPRLDCDQHALYRLVVRFVNQVMDPPTVRYLGLITKIQEKAVVDELHGLISGLNLACREQDHSQSEIWIPTPREFTFAS